MTTAPPRGLYMTLAVTVALVAALAALLFRPSTGIKPLRAATFELDEPPVPLPSRPGP
jgi:hypothetical protein